MSLNKTIFLICVLAALTSLRVCQVLSQEKKVTLELVKTIPPSDKITNYYFNKVKYIGDQEVFYEGKRITFFAASGNSIRYIGENDEPILEKEYKYRKEFISVSNNGRYIFVADREINKCRLETMEGEIIWEKALPERLKGRVSSDGIPLVTPNGGVVLSLNHCMKANFYPGCGEDRLEFYDRSGKVTQFGTLRNEGVWPHSHLFATLSPEGNYYGFCCIYEEESNKMENVIVFYDLTTLEELWIHREKARLSGNLLISPDGEHLIAVSGTDETKNNRNDLLFFDKHGKIYQKLSESQIGDASQVYTISPDGNYVVITAKRNKTRSLHLFEIPTGKMLWRYADVTNNPRCFFGEISISKEAKRVFCIYSYPEGPYLLIFNKQGRVIYKERTKDSFGKILMSPDGQDLWSLEKRKTNHFKLKDIE